MIRRAKWKSVLLVLIIMIFGAAFTGCAGREAETEKEPNIIAETNIPDQEVDFEE